MNEKRLPAVRDAIEREHLEQTVLTAGYALLRDRIQAVIEQQRELLCSDLDPVKTAEARGMVRGLRLALATPGVLMSEYKAKGGQ